MATWDTGQFNFMAQTADQMADNRFQRLAQEQAENERRFRRDLAEQEANHRFNMDMNRDQRDERRFNQAYEIAAAAETRAQQSHEQGLSDARAAAERAAAAENRAQTAWEQSQSERRRQLADAELARQFAGLTPEQRIAAYLRAGLKYNDLSESDRQFLYNQVTGGGNTWSNASIHTWLTSQPLLADQDNLLNFIRRQHSGNTGTYTYAPSAPAASAASGQRTAPAASAPLNADQQQALLAFEYLSRKGGEVSADDPFKGLDATQKAAFLRVFGNGAESLTADQVRAILNDPYAFSRFGFGYETLEAKNRLLAAVPQFRAGQKQNQPAPAPETAETRFQHLSNDQRLALMAFMAMRENDVSFASLPQDQQAAFRKVFAARLADGRMDNRPADIPADTPNAGGTPAERVQTPTTPEAIAQSGDLSAIFGLQTTDQARENENTGRIEYNRPETTQARLTNFVSEMDGDTRLAYEAFAAIHSGVKLSDLPENMRSAFFRQFNNGNRFTTDEAANTFVKDLGNLGSNFHTSQERNAFLQLMKQGYQSRQEATSQAEQARREAETQRYRDEAELALRNANPRKEVTDNEGRTTVIGGDDPSEGQVNALARIMQRYGLPADQALAISQDNQKLGLLRDTPAALYRSAVTKFGRDFTGLDFAQQAALLAAYQDILNQYMREIGNTGSSSLTPNQTAKIQQLTRRWQSAIDRLSIDSAVANRLKSKSPFSAVPRFTYTPSAQ